MFCNVREGFKQCVAVCCSVLRYVAVCCDVLQCQVTNEASPCFAVLERDLSSVLQCVAVCCSVLRCVAVCYSVMSRMSQVSVLAVFERDLSSVLQCVEVSCHE